MYVQPALRAIDAKKGECKRLDTSTVVPRSPTHSVVGDVFHMRVCMVRQCLESVRGAIGCVSRPAWGGAKLPCHFDDGLFVRRATASDMPSGINSPFPADEERGGPRSMRSCAI